MATPTIPNGEEYFFPIIYEGNGAGQRVGKFVPFTDNGTIDNSCIFNKGDSAQLERTPSSNGNRRTFTVSAWVKRCVLGTEQHICSSWDGSSTDNNSMWEFRFLAANTLSVSLYTTNVLITNRTFEDTSKFYHVLMAVDTTQATASDRVKLYVDGDEITSFSTDNRSSAVSQNFDTAFNNTADACVVGNRKGASLYFDGYMAEVNLVDGTALTPSTFGVTDTSTGRWIPKTLSGITYGTNGFRLKFQDSSALGDDTSGNGNDLTATNLASTDQTTDSPTQNHATLNFNPDTGGTLSEGNLKLVTNGVGYNVKLATLRPKSGKYYAEFTIGSGGYGMIGVQELATAPSSSSTAFPQGDGSFGWYEGNGNVYTNGSTVATSGSTYTSGDVLAIALDLDNQEVKFYKNNTLDNTIGLTGKDIAMAVGDFANAYNATITANFGQKSFSYTPPTGFVALQQDNLPSTDKGISGLVWIKNRDVARVHHLYDSSRGQGNRLVPNDVNDENYITSGLFKFLKGGCAVGDSTTVNESGKSMVSWNWVANGGTTASNTDGSITSTVQANTTAGFSIVQWTGLGGGTGRTIGHGLSSAPEWIVVKPLTGSSSYNWNIYHIGTDASNPSDYFIALNTNSIRDNSANLWNDTAPTSTVFSVNHEATAGALGNEMITYCWHGVDGFSKFGSYTGNGSTDGPFVYLGFKPAWVMFKRTTVAATDWALQDNKRDTFNPSQKVMTPNQNYAEFTNSLYNVDFLSNGFKIRNSTSPWNISGSTYIYMAFAEHPFVGDGTNPVTAR